MLSLVSFVLMFMIFLLCKRGVEFVQNVVSGVQCVVEIFVFKVVGCNFDIYFDIGIVGICDYYFVKGVVVVLVIGVFGGYWLGQVKVGDELYLVVQCVVIIEIDVEQYVIDMVFQYWQVLNVCFFGDGYFLFGYQLCDLVGIVQYLIWQDGIGCGLCMGKWGLQIGCQDENVQYMYGVGYFVGIGGVIVVLCLGYQCFCMFQVDVD